MQQTNRSRHRHMTSFQVISLGFLSVILLGSLLLMLPIATKSGQCTSFLDALFTATSAVCVTGLVINDTATYWSLFGQGVILLLIQIGGMGIITIAIAIAVVSGRKIGLMQRSTMQEAISAPTVGGIVRRTKFIIRTTILIEIIGAVLLAPVFCRDFGFWKGIWYSLFHSISAFCNAGFDLIGIRTPFSSLTSYSVEIPFKFGILYLRVDVGCDLRHDPRRKRGYNRAYDRNYDLLPIHITPPFYCFRSIPSILWCADLTLASNAAIFGGIVARSASSTICSIRDKRIFCPSSFVVIW